MRGSITTCHVVAGGERRQPPRGGERDRRLVDLIISHTVARHLKYIPPQTLAAEMNRTLAGRLTLHTLRNHLRQEIVSVSGYSSTRPIDPGDGVDAWARNHRIDLRFVMEVDSKERLKQILDLTDDMKAQIDRLPQAGGGP